MRKSGVTLEQVLEEVGWTAKWEARGRQNEALDIAKNLINLGLPAETIVSATKLDPEKVKMLFQESG